MKQKLIISAMIIKLIKSLILKQLHIDHCTLKIISPTKDSKHAPICVDRSSS